jgi:metal-responsive CopG/Arc/MetJ family transcriptional regulator
MLERIDEIAFAESSPTNRVCRSDVVRYALADYITAHDDRDEEDE